MLTLHPDYFRLRTPLEKAVYQVVRKHCGEQDGWRIGLEKLHAKTGSASPMYKFRYQVRTALSRNGDDDFLDYRIGLDGGNLVSSYVAEPRRITADTQIRHRRLTARTLDILRRERPDLDAGEMERKWRKWAAKQKGTCRNAQAAFLGFCRKQPAPDSGQSDGDKGLPHVVLDWWNALTPERRRTAVRKFRICGEGTDWAFRQRRWTRP